MNVEVRRFTESGKGEERPSIQEISGKILKIIEDNKARADAIKSFIENYPDSPEKDKQMPLIMQELDKLLINQDELISIIDNLTKALEQSPLNI